MANSLFKKKSYPFQRTNLQQDQNHDTTETEVMTDQQPQDENNAQEQADATTNIRKELHQGPGQQSPPEKDGPLHPIHLKNPPAAAMPIQQDTTSQALQPLVEPQAITTSAVQTMTLQEDQSQEATNLPSPVQPTAMAHPQQEALPQQTVQAQPVAQHMGEPASQPMSQPVVQPTAPQMVQPTMAPAHQPMPQAQSQPQVPTQNPIQGTVTTFPGQARRTRTPRQDGRITLNAVIDKTLYTRLKVAAHMNGINMKAMVEELIRRNCPEI